MYLTDRHGFCRLRREVGNFFMLWGRKKEGKGGRKRGKEKKGRREEEEVRRKEEGEWKIRYC